jgi:hypothetical protein
MNFLWALLIKKKTIKCLKERGGFKMIERTIMIKVLPLPYAGIIQFKFSGIISAYER